MTSCLKECERVAVKKHSRYLKCVYKLVAVDYEVVCEAWWGIWHRRRVKVSLSTRKATEAETIKPLDYL
jgi:hypothetical protein